MVKIDLTGKKFGRWIVLKKKGIIHERPAWLCLCECGTVKVIQGGSLRGGYTKSCGCIQKETVTTHNMSKSTIYSTWVCMLQRCNNPKYTYYSHYGGRGIKVCKRWMQFDNFLTDMGIRPNGLTLERIDNSKGYFKENCKWASMTEQARNKRPPKKNSIGIAGVTIDGRRNSKKYRVNIMANGKHYSLGVFHSLSDAIEARKQGEQKYWNQINQNVTAK